MKTIKFWRMAFFSMLAFMTLSFTDQPVVFNQDEWKLVAQRKVNFVHDKDEIVIVNTQPLTGIRFSAQERAVGVSEIKVHFASGEKLEPNVDEIIKEGEQSSIIDIGAGKLSQKLN